MDRNTRGVFREVCVGERVGESEKRRRKRGPTRKGNGVGIAKLHHLGN